LKLRVCLERGRRLADDGMQLSTSLGNSQNKLVGLQGEAPKLMQSLDEIQRKVGSNRLEVARLLIDLEKER
jgi:E3 ubiquitin-protein ligase BRE1